MIFFNDIHFDSSWSARLSVNRAACSLLQLKSCNIGIPLWMQQIRFKNHYRNAICRLLSACSSVERCFPNYWRPSQLNAVSYFAKSTEPSRSNFFLIFFTFFYVLSYLHSMDTILAVFLIVVRCPFESQGQSELSRSY